LTKEQYAALGALILQQMHDLTDEETVSQFSFNIQWHYALDISGVSDESKYLSLKTLWRLRHLVMKEKLDVELCPVKVGKKNHYLHYDLKTMRIANRRAMEYSPEFKDKYRWRSGIEATFSEMDKRTGGKRLRVRGLPAVAYSSRLKAIAINLFRATAGRKALGLPGEVLAAAKSGIRYTIFVFKEQFLKPVGLLVSIFTPVVDELRYELKIAA